MAEEEEGISLCVICQEENGNELRESETGIPSLIQYASICELEQLKTSNCKAARKCICKYPCDLSEKYRKRHS